MFAKFISVSTGKEVAVYPNAVSYVLPHAESGTVIVGPSMTLHVQDDYDVVLDRLEIDNPQE